MRLSPPAGPAPETLQHPTMAAGWTAQQPGVLRTGHWHEQEQGK